MTLIWINFQIIVFEPFEWITATPAGIYLFKVNNGSTRTMCEICSKSASMACSGVFIVSFEQISHIVLVFPLLTLNK